MTPEILWNRGSVKRAWFSDSLKSEPVLDDFSVPKGVSWEGAANDTSPVIILLGTAALVL